MQDQALGGAGELATTVPATPYSARPLHNTNTGSANEYPGAVSRQLLIMPIAAAGQARPRR